MIGQARSIQNDFLVHRKAASAALNPGWVGMGHLLAQFSVDGQDLRVAHEGKCQDGHCVGRLKK